ncbi:MAG: universal stress protein [Deltaproteobacteria bacterium]|nr:universal stress protein [Deltaproteobacteria bacterium]
MIDAVRVDTASGSRILVAVDLSHHSGQVIRTALDLARGLSADVTLLHIVTASPEYSPWNSLWVSAQPSVPIEPDSKGEVPDAAYRRELVEYLRLFQNAGIGASLQVVSGLDPASEILRVAGERSFRFIVMGTHGRSGIEHWLMGSVAERTLRRASCPVVTVGTRGLGAGRERDSDEKGE